MPFQPTGIDGLLLFEPKIWGDERGYFYESYNANTFKEAGIEVTFVQDNQAGSVKGVLRGLHYQVPPMDMVKLVRVVQGEVLDVVVDIRPESITYGQVYSVLLSAENHKELFIPRGFAHGYVVLSEWATFCYKCDNFYSQAHEGGIRYNDPTLQIDWNLPYDQLTISEKDLVQPLFGEHLSFSIGQKI